MAKDQLSLNDRGDINKYVWPGEDYIKKKAAWDEAFEEHKLKLAGKKKENCSIQ